MITHAALAVGCAGWILAFHVLWSREWALHHYKRACFLTLGIAAAWLGALFIFGLLINDAQGVLA